VASQIQPKFALLLFLTMTLGAVGTEQRTDVALEIHGVRGMRGMRGERCEQCGKKCVQTHGVMRRQ
jgi:hypothetical protein